MRKIIKSLLWTLLLLLILLVAALYWLLFTESGSRKLEQLAMHYLPQLTIENASGRLLGNYRVDHVQWLDDTANVEATEMVLASDFSALLSGRITILELGLEKLVVDLQAAEQQEEEQSAESAGFSLPVDLVLEKLDIALLDFKLNGQHYPVEQIHLSGKISGSDVSGIQLNLNTEIEDRALAMKISGDLELV